MRRRPYVGILTEPIVLEDLWRPLPLAMGGGTPEADRNARLEYDTGLAEAIETRWSALCQHYGTTKPEIVAIKLALDYVPGFQVKAKKSRGRKPKWDALRPRFKSERSTLQYMLRQPLYRELTRGVTKISRLKELLGKVRSADHPMHPMLQEEWMKAIFIESFAVKKVDG